MRHPSQSSKTLLLDCHREKNKWPTVCHSMINRLLRSERESERERTEYAHPPTHRPTDHHKKNITAMIERNETNTQSTNTHTHKRSHPSFLPSFHPISSSNRWRKSDQVQASSNKKEESDMHTATTPPRDCVPLRTVIHSFEAVLLISSIPRLQQRITHIIGEIATGRHKGRFTMSRRSNITNGIKILCHQE